MVNDQFQLMHHQQIDTNKGMSTMTKSLFHYLQFHGLIHISPEIPFALTKYAATDPEWNMTLPITNWLMPLFKTYAKNEHNIDIEIINVFSELERLCTLIHNVQDKRFFTLTELDIFQK